MHSSQGDCPHCKNDRKVLIEADKQSAAVFEPCSECCEDAYTHFWNVTDEERVRWYGNPHEALHLDGV